MIVSAIPFTGNKRKLWKKIEPLLPNGRVFVDMFLGGGTVALNVVDKYEYVIGAEIVKPLTDLHLSYQKDEGFIDRVTKLNNHYPDSLEGYLQLRTDYNLEPSSAKLQCLLLRSNSNMMRFSNKTGFNIPFGKRNHYNLERMLAHKEACSEVEVFAGSWEGLFGKKSVLPDANPHEYVFYSDCPYANSKATYNAQGGWTDEDDIKLLEKLLYLHSVGCKVVASNTLIHKGIINTKWCEWVEQHKDKFTVHHLNHSYANSSFRKSDKVTDEVLIVSK